MGLSEKILVSTAGIKLRNKVHLVFTSPPFPLNRKKKYGNVSGAAYITWLSSFAESLRHLLTPTGSIVLEMGNAWEKGEPVMSTLALEALLAFRRAGDFQLCQEFVWYNPARLPTPAQWVTVDRVRVKDAFTRLWWLSATSRPKADNRRVLVPYSGAMRTLLARGSYNAGRRPSEHVIGGRSFLKDNGGAIPSSVLQVEEEATRASPTNLLVGANTFGSDPYYQYCRQHGLTPHPARMPLGLAKFFVSLCTDPGDVVLDPFGGSNTTGAAAEELGRRWITIEANRAYASSGKGRFAHLRKVPNGRAAARR